MFGLARILSEECGLAFFSGSPGPMELIVIFLVVLVLFGPRRLPEIAKMIGKMLHELRRASEDFKDQVMSIETESQETEVTVSPTDGVMEDVFQDNEDDLPADDGILDEEPSPADAYGLVDDEGPAEGGGLDAKDETSDKTSEERNDLAG